MTNPIQPSPTPDPDIIYPSGPPGAGGDLQPFPMYPEGHVGEDGTWQVPQYPPFIPESEFDAGSAPMPRSTLDGIHGTTGDEPIRWSPSHPGELPPYSMHDYVQDQTDPNLWWPDKRPLAPGSTQPAAFNNGDKPAEQSGEGQGKLDVNPADLTNVSEQYAELQAAAAAISPQAVDEVNRIIASHGPMGYPVAVGVVTGLARRQAQLGRKAADFGVYATRFTEHAAAYQTTDADGARLVQSVSSSDPDDWFTEPGWHDFNEPIDPGGAAAGPNAGPAIPPSLI